VSLIGDALKRQQESQPVKPDAPERTPVASSAPPSSPLTLRSKAGGSAPVTDEQEHPPHAQKPAKRRPVMELILLGIGFILLIFAGAALYNWLTGGDATTEPAVMAVKPELTPEPPPAVTPPQTEAAAPVVAVSTPAQEEPIQPVETAAVPSETVVEEEQGAASPSLPEEPVKEEPVAAATAAVPDPAPEIVWPTMFIQGAMGSGNRGAVIVDGTVVAVGSEVYGVKIIEVTPDGVVTEYQGERRVMPVRK